MSYIEDDIRYLETRIDDVRDSINGLAQLFKLEWAKHRAGCWCSANDKSNLYSVSYTKALGFIEFCHCRNKKKHSKTCVYRMEYLFEENCDCGYKQAQEILSGY